MSRTWKAQYTGDILIEGMASWFGGGIDKQDNGETSSGIANDGRDPNLMGCALPLPLTQSTLRSPIPAIPWGTLVDIESDNGNKITVKLIDDGPQLVTNHPIDLTVAAFKALGYPLSKGLIPVKVRIHTTGLLV